MNEEFPKIYYSVRKGPSHCTSIGGLNEIHETGAILPSGGGQRQYWNSSFATHIGAVSLFNFESSPEKEVLEQAHKELERIVEKHRKMAAEFEKKNPLIRIYSVHPRTRKS